MVPVTGAIASYADDLVGRLHTATLCRALAVVPYAKRRAGLGPRQHRDMRPLFTANAI